ncbi:hypothetical protein CNMCM8980_003095 [Aspergillus fumigatiaffinis]|uniref:Zn(2)-C6 fungal-type domain-containing protein n=1 Tax=Aspergillus fumigatiaffinis TaxID=340414 RepID=A0A8H4MBG6_9EURO|nr:hypothetical protein CNMCM6457_002315 [Aspergillus fumigatiaffinis]KAF4239400.1 hypothetical protein CNMCM6805_005822 [Aspergillus fumigatiaffinis]KAF4249606.1 hypothetical protein CNMCM8980_003095 [Aspergillus fumigatiaffinis]
MTAPSRHMACRTCRERKVRCDGGQPSCETCKRHGEKCVYVQSSRQTKNDLLAKIDNLQERLARAEAKLNCSSSVSCPTSHRYGVPFVPTPSLSSIETSPPPSSHMDKPRPALSTPETPLGDGPGVDATIPSPDELAGLLSPFTSVLGPGTAEETPLSLPWSLAFPPLLDEQAVPEPVRVSTDSAPLEARPPSPCLPTLRVIRALNGQQLQQQHQPGPPQPLDDGCAILRELIRYVSATFTNQVYIAGMTTAVAEYLAWARRTPDINYSQILEILEARLRETANLANTKQWADFQNLQASLGNLDAYKWKLGLLEHELQAAEADISTFFTTHYDIRSALDLQRRS